MVDWYCDYCNAHLNDQEGFSEYDNNWTCSECGNENDLSDENIIPDEGSKGYVFESELENGDVEKIRFTKTREVHDFFDSNGNKTASIWSKR